MGRLFDYSFSTVAGYSLFGSTDEGLNRLYQQRVRGEGGGGGLRARVRERLVIGKLLLVVPKQLTSSVRLRAAFSGSRSPRLLTSLYSGSLVFSYLYKKSARTELK